MLLLTQAVCRDPRAKNSPRTNSAARGTGATPTGCQRKVQRAE